MLREKGGGGMQRTAFAAIERQFAAADRINRHASGVRGVLHGKFYIEFHRYVAEKFSLDPNETNLVVVLPRNVIARADVNVVIGQARADDRLHRLGLGGFLRGEPAPIQHVEEIGVAAGIELIGAFDFYAALAEEIDDGAV